MIEILIIAFIFTTLWHLLYEKVLLPSFIQKYKFQLFALRDKLRYLYTVSEDISDEEFNYVSQNIKFAINNIEKINFVEFLIIRKKLNQNQELLQELKTVHSIIAESKNKELKKIYNDVSFVVGKTSIANAGAWFLYLSVFLPFIIIYYLVKYQMDLRSPIQNSSETLIRYEVKNKFA